VATANRGEGEDEYQAVNSDLAKSIKEAQVEDESVEVAEYKLVRVFTAMIEHNVKEV
jgi:hypothetical protein